MIDLPNKIYAGDLLEFEATTPEKYHKLVDDKFTIELSNGYDVFTLEGKKTTTLGKWLFKVSSSDTIAFTPDNYGVIAVVTWLDMDTNYDESQTFWSGSVTVLTKEDTRSFARKCLEALNAALLSSGGSDVISISVDGKQIAKRSYDDALKWRRTLQSEVAAERQFSNKKLNYNI